MKKLCIAVFGVISVMSSISEANIDCSGLVQDALLYADGTVNIRGAWRGDFTFLCNTNGTWGGVSPEVGLTWYATAVNAAANGKQLHILYGGDGYTCATLPTY